MRDDEGRIIVEYNTSDWRYFHLDERGSPIAWSDPAGSLASVLRYGEYGTPASTNPGFFQYTGQLWLPALGVYNYKARMYAPHLGRFLQPDPIGYEDDANLYAYVGNDPVNYVDPLGLCGGPATWTGGSINIVGCQDWGPPGGTIGGGRGIAGGGPGNQDDTRDGSAEESTYPPPCNTAQRGLQKLGAAAVELGSELTTIGVGITAIGVVVAGISASTVVLAPGGVLLGGSIATGGANVTFGGAIIGTGGALLMLAGGSGKAAVSDLASRAISSKIPKGLGKDAAAKGVEKAVDKIPFELNQCR